MQVVANDVPIVFQCIRWSPFAVDFNGHDFRVITDNSNNLSLDSKGWGNVWIAIEIHSDRLADASALARF